MSELKFSILSDVFLDELTREINELYGSPIEGKKEISINNDQVLKEKENP